MTAARPIRCRRCRRNGPEEEEEEEEEKEEEEEEEKNKRRRREREKHKRERPIDAADKSSTLLPSFFFNKMKNKKIFAYDVSMTGSALFFLFWNSIWIFLEQVFRHETRFFLLIKSENDDFYSVLLFFTTVQISPPLTLFGFLLS